MLFTTIAFVLLSEVALADSNIVLMRDSSEFASAFYECVESTEWKKFCEYWDFTSGSCRPWRLHVCTEPYVQHQLSPCPSFSCKLQEVVLHTEIDPSPPSVMSQERLPDMNQEQLDNDLDLKFPGVLENSLQASQDHLNKRRQLLRELLDDLESDRPRSVMNDIEDIQRTKDQSMNIDGLKWHRNTNGTKIDQKLSQRKQETHMNTEIEEEDAKDNLNLKRNKKKKPSTVKEKNQPEDAEDHKRDSSRVDDRHSGRIPNATRSDDEKGWHRSKPGRNGAFTEDRNHQTRHHHHEHGKQPQELKRRQKRRKYHRSNSRFTTEATIRRVATDVFREKEATWQKQSTTLRENLDNQADILTNLRRKLDRQQLLWKEKDMRMAEKQKKQQDSLLSLGDKLGEIERLQHLQEATLREMETAQGYQELEHEETRFESFIGQKEEAKVFDLLQRLNITNVGDAELIQETNGVNISNVFIFPRIGKVTSNDTLTFANKTSSYENNTLTLPQRHEKFLTRMLWLDQTCYDRNGTKKTCSLEYHYSDPCIHFFCSSLCLWNVEDCKNFEPGPANLQCPYAKCEVVEEASLLWLWILLPLLGSTSLGVGAYCFCCRRRSQPAEHQQGQEEQRPLLERLRLREQFDRRPSPAAVELQELPLDSGEVTPASIISDGDGGDGGDGGGADGDGDIQNPIIRGEPRARFHRSGNEMRVTIENENFENFQPAGIQPRGRGHGRRQSRSYCSSNSSFYQTISLDRANTRNETLSNSVRTAASSQGLQLQTFRPRSDYPSWMNILVPPPPSPSALSPSAPAPIDADVAFEATPLNPTGSPPPSYLLRSPPPPYSRPLPHGDDEAENAM